jgi:hypothetical protein
MRPTLAGIEAKIDRAIASVNQLDREISLFTKRAPFTVRVDKEATNGGHVGRLVALKNPAVGEPDTSLVLLAGEILYQLRSSLDHLVHQLVILSGNEETLKDSRRHQFPIFETAAGFDDRALRMIEGVSEEIAEIVRRLQPFAHLPDHPRDDMLWILQDLNNTDKHRLIPVAVVGIDVVEATGNFRRGTLFTVQSPDIVLEDGKVFFSFNWNVPDEIIDARLACTIAFRQAMSPYGVTLGMDGLLCSIISRVSHVVDAFRPFFENQEH